MTLYSALGEVNTPDVNIQTAEDPIEYTLAGINQMQMSRAIGSHFRNVPCGLLRMDPDIILVGEIRGQGDRADRRRSRAHGSLVVSTLHTNDAPSTISRIGEMGVEAVSTFPPHSSACARSACCAACARTARCLRAGGPRKRHH